MQPASLDYDTIYRLSDVGNIYQKQFLMPIKSPEFQPSGMRNQDFDKPFTEIFKRLSLNNDEIKSLVYDDEVLEFSGIKSIPKSKIMQKISARAADYHLEKLIMSFNNHQEIANEEVQSNNPNEIPIEIDVSI